MGHRSGLSSWKLIGWVLLVVTGHGCLLPQPHTPPVKLGLPELSVRVPQGPASLDRANVSEVERQGDGGIGAGQVAGGMLGASREPILEQPLPDTPSVNIGGALVANQPAGVVVDPARAAGATPPLGAASVACQLKEGVGALAIVAPPEVVFELSVQADPVGVCTGPALPDQPRTFQLNAGSWTISLEIVKPEAVSMTQDVVIRDGQTLRLKLEKAPLTQSWRLVDDDAATSQDPAEAVTGGTAATASPTTPPATQVFETGTP